MHCTVVEASASSRDAVALISTRTVVSDPLLIMTLCLFMVCTSC
jgi:hypothetical protein